ncbi:CARDB domain-containing protein [Natronorubrum thiooxidans]|uniref:CARDB protein n=1 Tax=Natronorubrum thiooxidans TaxID=308853 RepID=A0A1N7FD20_9EURY|nr:CARDB domain-containing protein [Natronorubrum thiooxidans]SIR98125.1 CARDB protein [Natronorubrum thiooxidans]
MPSTKTLFAAAAACFLVAFAVPTVAITVGEDPASDDVVLEPVDQRYATVVDGELELDLTVLDNTVTEFIEVFTISVGSGADDIESIWISNDVDGLEFYAGTNAAAELTESNPLEPTAGQTTSIGVAVDTHFAQSGTETFTVHVRYEDEDDDDEDDEDDDPVEIPRMIDLESVDSDVTAAETGDSVTVTATYRNNGPRTETVMAAFTVNGVVVETKTLELAPGETASVGFERQLQWPGTYEIGVDGVSKSVTVEGPPINVLSASVTDAELTAGETTTIEATVTNPTEMQVDRTLELAVDGIVVDTRTVTLEPNSERTVTFDRQFTEPGTYAIAVSGVEAGSITVDEPEPTVLRNRDLSAATTAALAPPMAAGFLFLAAAANRRWAFVSREA